MARSRSTSRSSSSRSSARPSSASKPAASRNTPAPAPAPSSVAPPMQQSQQPSLFANMASTAAGVAVGHTIGNGISNMLFGGRSHQQVEAAPVSEAAPTSYDNGQSALGGSCDPDQRAFMKCLDTHSNDITACQFYLDMLKQCQASQSL